MNNTIIVAIVVALLAAFVPLDYLIDVVSIGTLTAFIVVSLGVIILRVPPARPAPRLQGAGLPGHADPVDHRLRATSCPSLHWYTWVVFALWVGVFLAFYFLYGQQALGAGPGAWRGGHVVEEED